MRELVKSPQPDYLVANALKLTAEYVAEQDADSRSPSPWRHEEIRQALSLETSGRCAYCDSFIRAVTFEHVEHIEPKSKHPDRVVDWANLTIACPRCNQYKGNYCDHDIPLLNPYVDKVAEHLVFLGPLVLPKPGDDRGLMTVRKIKLARADLTEARSRRIAQIEALVDQWSRSSNASIRAVLAEFIVDDSESGDYKESVLSYLNGVGFFHIAGTAA